MSLELKELYNEMSKIISDIFQCADPFAEDKELNKLGLKIDKQCENLAKKYNI